ncbi:MAG: DCC1-like thiol-disulfide oxidoreductase family protein [Leptospira sp.]|nr:DCC1-like thiol-disulfide oxidoreductase family protein [Leptospira sp.]
MDKDKIVFFDGFCHLCNGSVQFLLKANKNKNLYFAPLQSEFRKINFSHIPEDSSSICYFSSDTVYKESDAILQITRELTFPYYLLYWFRILPKSLRDLVYRWIARHRYQWFGKSKVCFSPSAEYRSRFLF